MNPGLLLFDLQRQFWYYKNLRESGVHGYGAF